MPILARGLVAAAALAAAAAHAAPTTYQVDPNHTFASFGIRHFSTSTVHGRFDKTSGTVTLDLAAHTGSTDITIEVPSISTGVPALDKHLQTPEFFNAEQFPTIKFVSDGFNFAGDKPSSVKGQLTIMGQTHPVKLKVTHFNCYQNPMLKTEVCGGDMEATIKRSEWGIKAYLPVVADEVKLTIQVEAVKQ